MAFPFLAVVNKLRKPQSEENPAGISLKFFKVVYCPRGGQRYTSQTSQNQSIQPRPIEIATSLALNNPEGEGCAVHPSSNFSTLPPASASPDFIPPGYSTVYVAAKDQLTAHHSTKRDLRSPDIRFVREVTWNEFKCQPASSRRAVLGCSPIADLSERQNLYSLLAMLSALATALEDQDYQQMPVRISSSFNFSLALTTGGELILRRYRRDALNVLDVQPYTYNDEVEMSEFGDDEEVYEPGDDE